MGLFNRNKRKDDKGSKDSLKLGYENITNKTVTSPDGTEFVILSIEKQNIPSYPNKNQKDVMVANVIKKLGDVSEFDSLMADKICFEINKGEEISDLICQKIIGYARRQATHYPNSNKKYNIGDYYIGEINNNPNDVAPNKSITVDNFFKTKILPNVKRARNRRYPYIKFLPDTIGDIGYDTNGNMINFNCVDVQTGDIIQFRNLRTIQDENGNNFCDKDGIRLYYGSIKNTPPTAFDENDGIINSDDEQLLSEGYFSFDMAINQDLIDMLNERNPNVIKEFLTILSSYFHNKGVNGYFTDPSLVQRLFISLKSQSKQENDNSNVKKSSISVFDKMAFVERYFQQKNNPNPDIIDDAQCSMPGFND